MQTMQIDVHRRKWNLVLHGLNGPAAEDERETRAVCIRFAKDVLKVPDAEDTRIAACHRLSRKQNAGVIIRFADLAQRDRWLAGTRNLRNHDRKVSLSPDLPPVLRPMKDALMLTRSKLAADIKSKSRVRYLPTWPFVELRIDGQPPRRPDTTRADLVTNILGINPVLRIRESVEPKS